MRLLLCHQHGAGVLAVQAKAWLACESRRKADKMDARAGKNTRKGKSREKLPSAGDVKNDTAGL